MKRFLISALLTLSLVLVACSATATPLQTDPQSTPVSKETASPQIIQPHVLTSRVQFSLKSPRSTFTRRLTHSSSM
jgi:hypothetical protein